MKKILFPLFLLTCIAEMSYGQVPPNTSKTKANARNTFFGDKGETAKPAPDQPNSKQNSEAAENVFPATGFAGIGTITPGAPLEIKRGAGNTTKKNFLLKLSNEWASSGQNEPSIMFSNGNSTDPKNISYWSIGARVSGDNVLKTPATFKISFKGINDPVEKDFFSVDSYEGRVRIGDVQTQYDGYKLFVEQGILTEKVKVAVKDSKDWYDQVFELNYPLLSIQKLEKFVRENKHLPDIPSTSEVMEKGLDLGQMNALLLKKVEEQTLYLIGLQKEMDAANESIRELKKELDAAKKSGMLSSKEK